MSLFDDLANGVRRLGELFRPRLELDLGGLRVPGGEDLFGPDYMARRSGKSGGRSHKTAEVVTDVVEKLKRKLGNEVVSEIGEEGVQVIRAVNVKSSSDATLFVNVVRETKKGQRAWALRVMEDLKKDRASLPYIAGLLREVGSHDLARIAKYMQLKIDRNPEYKSGRRGRGPKEGRGSKRQGVGRNFLGQSITGPVCFRLDFSSRSGLNSQNTPCGEIALRRFVAALNPERYGDLFERGAVSNQRQSAEESLASFMERLRENDLLALLARDAKRASRDTLPDPDRSLRKKQLEAILDDLKELVDAKLKELSGLSIEVPDLARKLYGTLTLRLSKNGQPLNAVRSRIAEELKRDETSTVPQNVQVAVMRLVEGRKLISEEEIRKEEAIVSFYYALEWPVSAAVVLGSARQTIAEIKKLPYGHELKKKYEGSFAKLTGIESELEKATEITVFEYLRITQAFPFDEAQAELNRAIFEPVRRLVSDLHLFQEAFFDERGIWRSDCLTRTMPYERLATHRIGVALSNKDWRCVRSMFDLLKASTGIDLENGVYHDSRFFRVLGPTDFRELVEHYAYVVQPKVELAKTCLSAEQDEWEKFAVRVKFLRSSRFDSLRKLPFELDPRLSVSRALDLAEDRFLERKPFSLLTTAYEALDDENILAARLGLVAVNSREVVARLSEVYHQALGELHPKNGSPSYILGVDLERGMEDLRAFVKAEGAWLLTLKNGLREALACRFHTLQERVAIEKLLQFHSDHKRMLEGASEGKREAYETCRNLFPELSGKFLFLSGSLEEGRLSIRPDVLDKILPDRKDFGVFMAHEDFERLARELESVRTSYVPIEPVDVDSSHLEAASRDWCHKVQYLTTKKGSEELRFSGVSLDPRDMDYLSNFGSYTNVLVSRQLVSLVENLKVANDVSDWIGGTHHLKWKQLGRKRVAVLGFGSHENEPLMELAKSSEYLQWCLDNMKNMPSHLREVFQFAIENKEDPNKITRWLRKIFPQRK